MPVRRAADRVRRPENSNHIQNANRMLNDNLIRLYAASFRANFDLPALTDYFKEETFT